MPSTRVPSFKTLLMALVIFVNAFSFAGDGQFTGPNAYRHFTRTRHYDILHQKLLLNFDLQNRQISGKTFISLKPLSDHLSRIILDAAGLHIQGIVLNNRQQLRYSTTPEQLVVELDRTYGEDDTLNLGIAYWARPGKGLYFVQPDAAYPDKPLQAWSQGEMEDNHYWFPCYDFPNDRFTSEMVATVPAGMMAISNGKLIGIKENMAENTRTFHWREDIPHVSYLISVVVGKFVELRDEWQGIPVSYYVEKVDREKAPRSFAKTPRMIEFFSQKIGVPYPYEKYAQTCVRDFMWGGMENISATTLTRSTLHDVRAHLDVTSDGLVAHELAHQWWGDLLTAKSWNHIWLNESFATYFDALFAEYDRGKEAYLLKMARNRESYLKEDSTEYRRAIVTDKYEDPVEMFDSHAYPKGAWVLQMIRYILGEEQWWKAIRYYAQTYREQVVETNDFREAIEKATGNPLELFFEQWLYHGGYPEYDLAWKWDTDAHAVALTVRQIQVLDSITPLFDLPVDVYACGDFGETRFRIRVSKSEETFSLPVSGRPTRVEFDPQEWILKVLAVHKEKNELLDQLTNSNYPMSRSRAADWLAQFPDDGEVLEALRHALVHDSFRGVREQAARTLGKMRSSEAAAALTRGLADRQSKVRIAVIKALANFTHLNSSRISDLLLKTFREDSSYYVQAEVVKALAKLHWPQAYDICLEALNMPSHNEVIRKAALKGFELLKNRHGIEQALKWAEYGRPQQVRGAAIETLGKLAKFAPEKKEYIRQVLIKYVSDPYFGARTAAMEALGELADPLAIPALQKAGERETNFRWKKIARKAIREIEEKREKVGE